MGMQLARERVLEVLVHMRSSEAGSEQSSARILADEQPDWQSAPVPRRGHAAPQTPSPVNQVPSWGLEAG